MTTWPLQLKKRSRQSKTHDLSQLDQSHAVDRRQPEQPAVRASVYPVPSAPVNSLWPGEKPGQTTVCKKESMQRIRLPETHRRGQPSAGAADSEPNHTSAYSPSD